MSGWSGNIAAAWALNGETRMTVAYMYLHSGEVGKTWRLPTVPEAYLYHSVSNTGIVIGPQPGSTDL